MLISMLTLRLELPDTASDLTYFRSYTVTGKHQVNKNKSYAAVAKIHPHNSTSAKETLKSDGRQRHVSGKSIFKNRSLSEEDYQSDSPTPDERHRRLSEREDRPRRHSARERNLSSKSFNHRAAEEADGSGLKHYTEQHQEKTSSDIAEIVNENGCDSDLEHGIVVHTVPTLSQVCRGRRTFTDLKIELIDKEALDKVMATEMIAFGGERGEEEPSTSRAASESRSSPRSLEDASRESDSFSLCRHRETKSEPDDRMSGPCPAGTPCTHGTSHSTSGSRPKSHSPTTKIPNTINFHSGNPSVELTKGILHIYKENQMTSGDKNAQRSEMLCMLGVPASYTIHDLIKFIAPMGECVTYMQVLRDAFPNQYLLLIKFRDQTSADDFYSYFNSRPYNSIEPDICHLVYVAKVEVVKESEGANLPLLDMTELPNCPVCLERMEESVDGILTVLCNHAFHTHCLAQWGDTSCPVCRYCQTPEEVADQRCMQCGSHDSLWICLICGNVGCGRYVGLHAYKHFQDTNHTYAMQLGTNRVWDYAGDNYVHRLAQNKSDGKLVEVDEGGNELQEEKLDSITLEYTYLLTTQLESQRLYFMEQISEAVKDVEGKLAESTERWETERHEREKAECQLSEVTKEKHALEKKCSQMHSRTSKVLSELQEERQMNKCLLENQQLWQGKVADLEKRLNELTTKKDQEIVELQDQLRDFMFYLDAQQKLTNSSDVTQEEIQEGQIIVGAAATPGSAGGSRGKVRKKPRK